MKKLEGIVVNMLSPMEKDFSLDETSLVNLCDHYIKNKVGAIWALGSAGEDFSLSLEYRKRFAKKISAYTSTKIPVILGIGNMSFDETVEFIDLNKDNDFYGYHILLYDQKISDQQAVRYVGKIADISDKPIWLYNNPKRGKLLSFQSVKELSQHSNIQGIKVGGYNLTTIINSVSLENENFQVMAAGGSQLFPCLCLGYKIHSTSDANGFPVYMNSIFNAFKDGELKTSRDLQYEYIKMMKTFPSLVQMNGEKSVIEKYICSLNGLCKEHANASYTYLDETSKKIIREKIKLFDLK